MSTGTTANNTTTNKATMLEQTLTSLDINKPDFRELDLVTSPVSPLRTRATTTTTTTTTSSSSSSGSVSGSTRPGPTSSPPATKNHSGELSSPINHHRNPLIYSGGATNTPSNTTVNSPVNVNVLPTGNICPSGKILKAGMSAANRSSKSDVLGSGTGNYGHGSIMRSKAGSSEVGARTAGLDPEEVKRAGNEMYKKGLFGEALGMYEKAIAMVPGNAAYRFNKAAALMGLGRLIDALKECQEAVRLEPSYYRAHHRLGALFIRLGEGENARRHLCYPGYNPDPIEMHKLHLVEKHLSKCSDARKVNDWKSALRESDAAITAGADHCSQLFMCRAEALLKLHQLDEVESCLSNCPKIDPHITSCSQTRFFGMLSEAYPLLVQAQIDMALGRFENAVTAAEKAGQIDPRNVEVSVLLKNVKLVARARARGNDLFKSERFTEACSAYGEGLRIDPSNSVLYCNRAACWYKLGQWERSADDCNQALRVQPNYTKALLRRAASNSKLERWAEAVRDYEILRRELPNDNEVAESLFHAQVALKKSRGEEVHNMKFGGEVEVVTGHEQFRAAISLPGISVVHFKSSSNFQCKQISPFVDTLCSRYPSINFLMVDVEESPTVANAENVRIVPTFKIYKNGSRVKEIVCPSRDVLEHSVRHYSF